jgi:hypothetical protein
VVEASPEILPHMYRSYSINMEQLYHDFNAQNWSAIYDMPDPDEQIRHFDAIVLWLLDLHHCPTTDLSAFCRHYLKPWKLLLEGKLLTLWNEMA